MHSKVNFTKYINIDSQMEIRKIVYLRKFKNDSKDKLNLSSDNSEKNKNISKFLNSDKINNCGSLYIQDFEIKHLNYNIVKQKKCKFNSLPEHTLNPFLSYSTLNDINENKIIDLRNIKDTEEPTLLLNNIYSE